MPRFQHWGTARPGRGIAPAIGAVPELWKEVFIPYPGAHLLCSQHITASAGHVLWTAYTTHDAPDKVKAFYKTQYPDRVRENGESISIEAPPHKTLSVYPTASLSYPRCAPGPEAKTVIIVDELIK